MKTLAGQAMSFRAGSPRLVEEMLSQCGIELNGSRPFDLRVTDSRAFQRIVRQGSLGLGESYMDGQWECERIDKLVERLLRHSLGQHFSNTLARQWLGLMARIANLQSRSRALLVGQRHYDIGNDLYIAMLDSYMNYSCGYWESAVTLEQAQQDKMELICRKLELKPGMALLDIGCGWGGMARYAAEHYGVKVVGVTISKEQHKWANAHLQDTQVKILCQDYRDVQGQFDRIVSVGMFEHVGYKNYPEFFRKCHHLLRDDGLLLLHTIGSNYSVRSTDPWVHRYIFPNGMLPSVAQIGRAIESYFMLEDWHSFGPYYDKTLMTWHQRVNQAWSTLGERYDERFQRMWNYYLLSCAGAFRARHIQLWQLVLSKGGRSGVYKRPTLTKLPA